MQRFRMDRQTLRDWVHCDNAEGVKGLSNRGGGEVKPWRSPDQIARLWAWAEAGTERVAWCRRVDLTRLIKAKFGIA